MTNIIRATWNIMKLRKAVRHPWNKQIVPMLLLQQGIDDFSEQYNIDLIERVHSERRNILKKLNCYAQGHLIIPAGFDVRMDGRASVINVRYGGLVRDGVVRRDESIEGWNNYAVFLGKTRIYSGFLDIVDGLKKIAYFGENGISNNLGVDLLPQVADWYTNFIRERKY